jgi:ADP-ribose pyrophosphatase YjhB (NUDIX family)
VAATAIIHKDGKYLLLQRSLEEKAFPGKWTVPGGNMETDDYVGLPANKAGQWYNAVEKSLKREVKEESNLEVDKLNFLVDITFIRPDGIPVVILSYWAHYKSGEAQAGEDNIDFKWATLEEAKNYDLIPGIWEEIEMVDKIIKDEN